MSADFKQNTVVVTGAGSGIAFAITQQLLALGAQVAAMDLDVSALDELSTQYGAQLLALQADVSDLNAVEHAINTALQQFGRIDKLVCGAGRLQMGSVVELNPVQWANTFATNTTGVFNLCHVVSKHMIAQRKGAIVNISSNVATAPRSGMAAYAASKAAVTQLSRCLGLELAPYGIRVNIVSPGSTDTAMQRAMWEQGSSKETVIQGSLAQYRLGIPLQKIATPDDIAQTVIFLLSGQANHVTMHDLRVDGGATLDQ